MKYNTRTIDHRSATAIQLLSRVFVKEEAPGDNAIPQLPIDTGGSEWPSDDESRASTGFTVQSDFAKHRGHLPPECDGGDHLHLIRDRANDTPITDPA